MNLFRHDASKGPAGLVPPNPLQRLVETPTVAQRIRAVLRRATASDTRQGQVATTPATTWASYGRRLDFLKDFKDLKAGWGTWIRTRTDGVRVRCSTVKLFPNGERRAAKIEAAAAKLFSHAPLIVNPEPFSRARASKSVSSAQKSARTKLRACGF